MQLRHIIGKVVVCVNSNIPIAAPIIAILDAGWFEEELPAVIDSVHIMRAK
jgi:hypothetical protein